MTDLRIAYANDLGRIVVVCPAPKARRENESESDFVARIAAKDVPAGKDFQVLHKDDLPNRRFRNCWKLDQKTVSVDLEAARIQAMDEIRAERNKRLDESDKLKARTDEVGTVDEKETVAMYRQSLRDLPEVIERQVQSAKTAKELAAIEPAWPEHPEDA